MVNLSGAVRFFDGTNIISWGDDGNGIAYYGFLIAMAMLVGVVLGYFLSRRRGMPRDTVLDMMLWCIPLAIVGARLYYVIFDIIDGGVWRFSDIFQLRMSGLAIYGGVLAAILGCFLLSIFYKRKKKPDAVVVRARIDGIKVKIEGLAAEIKGIPADTEEGREKIKGLNRQIKKLKAENAELENSLIPKPTFFQMADLGAPFLILGQAIGRWGNYFNGEAFGPLISEASGWPKAFPLAVWVQQDGVWGWHVATFFIEFVWCTIGFLIMLYLSLRKKPLPSSGFVIAFYLIFYGVGRFVIEIFRTDSLWLVPGVIKISMVVAAALIICGALIIAVPAYKKRKNARLAAGAEKPV